MREPRSVRGYAFMIFINIVQVLYKRFLQNNQRFTLTQSINFCWQKTKPFYQTQLTTWQLPHNKIIETLKQEGSKKMIFSNQIIFFAIAAAMVGIAQQQVLTDEQYYTLQLLEDKDQYSLAGEEHLAKVYYVTDGDSVKLIFKLLGEFQRLDFRVDGIDTPELRSGVVREFGTRVKEILDGMIGGLIVRVETGEFDKYGRVLSVIYAMTEDEQEININDFLVAHAMAKPYDGGTKDEFTQQDYDYFLAEYNDTEWPVFVDYPLKESFFSVYLMVLIGVLMLIGVN